MDMAAHTPAGGLKSVLIVDDDKQFVELLRKNLTRDGYTVYCGYDGHRGVHLAQTYRPDLIVMDVNMPLMNGIKGLERLRSAPQTAQIPGIFVSEMVSQVIAPVVNSDPRAAHIKKPVDLADLQSLLRQFIQRFAA